MRERVKCDKESRNSVKLSSVYQAIATAMAKEIENGEIRVTIVLTRGGIASTNIEAKEVIAVS
jgi:hypothetical protein